jgi:ArsR family transcriptional regulator
LCADAALGVSDMARALKQSEPRVSRHLKILSEAGLIERLRQGQWVHYRLAPAPEASSFVRGLLAQLDRRDAQLLRDATGARAAIAADAQAAGRGTESRLGRALVEFVKAGAPGVVFDSVLVVGVMHPELLEWAARSARQCTALAPSRRAAQGARAFADRRGFSCRVLTGAADDAWFGSELARGGPHFDALLLDHPASGGEALARVMAQARGLLVPKGRLWMFEPYESLEGSRARVIEHPLARLRRLLEAAGLHCERLSPIEADGEHVLAAIARPVATGPVLMTNAQGAA